ncbi:hypothetical protein EDB80DRAFT_706260 [Ilyonectria destructans]|nr:hypothetical protein EDB80DRAFT_706260 [Ilyonectria destructans]
MRPPDSVSFVLHCVVLPSLTSGAMPCHILPLTDVNLTTSSIPCLTTRVSAPKHPPPPPSPDLRSSLPHKPYRRRRPVSQWSYIKSSLTSQGSTSL